MVKLVEIASTEYQKQLKIVQDSIDKCELEKLHNMQTEDNVDMYSDAELEETFHDVTFIK